MSKVCGTVKGCPYAPKQDSGGCPCAETCPGYVDPFETVSYSDCVADYIRRWEAEKDDV